MRLDWKKIGIIALFVGAVALFAFSLYWFFFRTIFAPEPPPTDATNLNANGRLPTTVNINGRIYLVNTNGRLPDSSNVNLGENLIPIEDTNPTDVAQGSLTKTDVLVNSPTRYATYNSSGSLIYYDSATGKFQIVSAGGDIKAYSNKIFYNVRSASWSNDGTMAALEYPDGSNIIYDFANNKQITLPKHWQEFEFSPDGGQIAFKSIALDPENRFLAVANPDGSQIKILESIGGVENQFKANWSPNNQMVATFSEGIDANRSEVFFIGLNNENFKSMIVEGRDFRGVWSPEGNKMIYSVYSSENDYKPQLWIADANPNSIGANRRSIGLDTWGNKCSFADSDRVICAVPQSLPSGAGLAPESANQINDYLYEINLATGAKKLLAVPEGSHTIDQVIASNSDYVFFSDRNDGRIYRIKL